MNEKELHQILVQNINRLMNTEQNHAPSMRYLSTCIDANESYIQKILNSSTFPSCEKLLAIANHYEIEPWVLLFRQPSEDSRRSAVLQLLQSCPEELLPVIHEFILYLLNSRKQ